MNTEEQTLIDGLFTRLQHAELEGAPRDAQAQAWINQHLAAQPAAAYYMAQSLLVQEAALKQLNQQNQQLKAELEQARAASAAPAATGGSFLSGLFGGADRSAPVAPVPASSGGWRDGPASTVSAPAAAPAPAVAQPGAPAMGGGFLSGALKTAAGVAGGVMLAQGLSSLFGHQQQPQVVEEIINEQPLPASDNQQFAGNDNFGLDDSGLDDDNLFSDDDSFV